jgi:hypothetical protein
VSRELEAEALIIRAEGLLLAAKELLRPAVTTPAKKHAQLMRYPVNPGVSDD